MDEYRIPGPLCIIVHRIGSSVPARYLREQKRIEKKKEHGVEEGKGEGKKKEEETDA